MTYLAALAMLPLLLVLAIVVVRAPVRILLATYAAVLPFGSAIRVPLPLPGAFRTASSVLGLMCSAVLAINLVLARRRGPRLLPHVPVALLLLAWGAFGYLWSVNGQRTKDELLVIAALVVLYVLVSVARHTSQDVAWFEVALVVGAAISAVYGIYLLRTGQLQAGDRRLPRFGTAGGTEGGDPGVTAATLVLPLVVALYAAYSARRPLVRFSALAASALIVTAVVLTGSRGGIIGAVCAILVLAGYMKGERLVRYILIAVAVGAVAYFAAPTELREHLIATSSTGRSEIWRVAARACHEHCVSGSGLGTFPVVYRDTLVAHSDLSGDTSRNYKAHNILVAQAVEGGVVGLTLMLSMLALVLRELRKLPRDRRGPPIAALVGVFVCNMFLTNFAFKYFWLVLIYASMCSLASVHRERTDPARQRGTADLRDFTYTPS